VSLCARLAAGLLALLAGAAQAAAAPTGLPLHACRLRGLEHDAQCGVLRRPLDPARPDGVQFDLHVAILPALARQKQPDPVFFFAGGPGQSAIGLAGPIEHMLARIGTRRDVVLIDQRGTGHSAPLQCDTPSAEESIARAFDRPRLVAALDACRAQLQKLPWGDLRFYTTTLAMADADAVRAALGAERVNLAGVSYGTRAALEYLRLYPQHVRRAVLDGVAPPDMTLPESFDVDGRAALAAVFSGCAAEAACARAHPRLDATWQRLVAGLPREVEVAEPTSGRPLRLVVTPHAVAELLRPGLYTPAVGAVLPQAIEEAAAGRFGALLALAAIQQAGPADVSEGEHFSVVCSEDVPRLPALAASEARPETGSQPFYRSACAHWPRGEVAPAFYAIPATRSPVLLLSGTLDPVTPPRHAERAARALGALARSVVVPNNGHGALAIGCLRDAVYRFLDAALDADALAVDFSCAAHLPRPPAFQPPLPQRAASAANDPRGFGDDASRASRPDPSLGRPPAAASGGGR
jgi:pimeloyl-ACP methyl ester carboxylesterase